MTPYFEAQIGHEHLALLKDGEQAFPAMLAAVAAARRSVCVETYILRDDTTGSRFAEALAARARAGLDVRVIYDALGSSLSDGYLDGLERAGVRAVAFGPLASMARLRNVMAPLLRRNHRKALIVDAEVAFLGGLNLSDDYAALADGGRGWRDTHLRVRGPAVADVQALFDTTWEKSGGPWTRGSALVVRDGPVALVGNDFGRDRRYIRDAYLRALDGARRRVSLTHAYFLPTRPLERALLRAVRRGVKVRVVTSGATDQPVVRLAAQGLYRRLLEAGARIFELHGRVLHAKTATVDGVWATVGSANFDAMSLRRNLELNAFVLDEAFAGALERLFEDDVAGCREVTLATLAARPWWVRLLGWLLAPLRPWL